MNYSIPGAVARRSLTSLLILLGVMTALFVTSLTYARLGGSPGPRQGIDSVLPQADTHFIRRISLTANDLVYNPTSHQLFASVPSSVGAGGNSIVSLDPLTGSLDAPVFIGSEPKKLALSDDGQSLYAYLDGAAAIRRFDIPTHTPGQQFQIGQDQFFGLYLVTDFAVAPGNPNLLAVARSYRGISPPEAGVAIYDNGVRRPTVTPGHTAASDFLAFSASASKLYGGGFYSGLNTMAVDASGVSITSTKTFAAGNAIRFDNGRVYGSTGQVINPDTGTLVGTFTGVGSGPFTTDSSVGRAYFLTGSQTSSNYSVTLRAFDINTFLQVGSLTIDNVNGNVTSLVRFGANGLAFRSDGGQLFLIQTSLVPSADPIPTPTATPIPTATPTPTPFDTFVRRIPAVSNDIAYSPATQLFYASLPSSAGSNGNSILPVDPETGVASASVFIGSEPTRLAMSSDGQLLYAALEGAASVRRFNVASQTAGLQFSLGAGQFVGPLFANDIAVMPGDNNSVAVSRANRYSSPSSDGVAIYDNGVMRTKTTNNSSFSVEFSDTPDKLYSSAGGNVDRLTADASGVTYQATVATLGSGEIRFDNGLIYNTGGTVIDPETGIIKGSFTGFNNFNFSGDTAMTTDSGLGRAFFLTLNGTQGTLRAYDLNTFVPLGSITFPIPNSSFTGTSNRLVRWGANGLAFKTATEIFFIKSSLVSASGVVPTPTPTPTPTASPTPTPYVPTFVRQVNLPVNDLVATANGQTLYASVPSSAGPNGNSITPINPLTGDVGQSVLIGSEPNRLALSDDDTQLHVSLDGAAAIRRFNVTTQTAATQFSWGTSNQRPGDMAVVPGSPLALATTDGTGVGVAIYDDGVRRTKTGNGGVYAIGTFAFGSPTTLYGYDSYSSGFELVKFAVDANGVTGTLIGSQLMTGFYAGMKFSNGLLYSPQGRVVDPEAKSIKGTFQNVGSSRSMVVDAALHRVFFLISSGSNVVISAFDSDTFLAVGSVTLSGINGNPVRLVRWGTNGLAFNTVNNSGSPEPNLSKVYLLQTELVSTAAPVPSGIQLGASNYLTFESTGNLNVTVSRTGNVSAAATIDYATSDGTATAGSDYSTVSGTLSFAAGQLTKTIALPILDDNIYEGTSETFNITLSNPTGGALLVNPASAVVTINDNESKPTVFLNSFRSAEGNSGTRTFNVPVSLSNASFQDVSVSYATEDGSATAGSDYTATSGSLVFKAGTTTASIPITVNGDTVIEPDETVLVKLSNPVNAFTNSPGTVTIANDDSSVQFASATYSIAESGPTLVVTVTRAGDLSGLTTVGYSTSDPGITNCAAVSGVASPRCDFTNALGTLTFTIGQSSKTIPISIVDDAYAEGNETFTIDLGTPSIGALGSASSATLTIIENDSANGPNPIDQADYFVRMHYRDFLNRDPDAPGLAYWANQITECGADAACIDIRRVNVSAAFFLSIEFQETGYLVERIYKSAYGDADALSALDTYPSQHSIKAPIVRFNEFLGDSQQISKNVQVGVGNWTAQLEANKVAFTQGFVTRTRFTNAYPTKMTPAQFVDALFVEISVVPDAAERTSIINEFGGAGTSADTAARARALRRVAENEALKQAEKNKAFVLMQYFGYMRRNPDDPQDTDHTGYDFWLHKLNEHNGNFVSAEMVKAFIVSGEYRNRFGQ